MGLTIIIGSYVQIKQQSAIGQVIDISLQKVLVSVGKNHFYLPIQCVALVTPPPSISKPTKRAIVAHMPKPSKSHHPILDLHGLNTSQALLALEKFLDNSLLSSHNQLKIIHGQGKGILRSAIRAYLRAHPLVKEIILESPIHCMAGMTIVNI